MFVIQCDNKGCKEMQEPTLDVKTNEVICSECQNPITNVTHFTKVQMKSLGQIKRDDKKSQAYSVKCPLCSKEGCPVLNDNKEIVCQYCAAAQSQLSGPFKQVIMDHLRAR